jgi:hypothetical protein
MMDAPQLAKNVAHSICDCDAVQRVVIARAIEHGRGRSRVTNAWYSCRGSSGEWLCHYPKNIDPLAHFHVASPANLDSMYEAG